MVSWSVSLGVCGGKVEMIRLKFLWQYQVSSSRFIFLISDSVDKTVVLLKILASNLLTSYYSYLYENIFIFAFYIINFWK